MSRDGLPPVMSVDQMLADVRAALALDDNDAVMSLQIVAEYVPMTGPDAGSVVLAWTISRDLPIYRAVGALEVVKRRQLARYDEPNDDDDE